MTCFTLTSSYTSSCTLVRPAELLPLYYLRVELLLSYYDIYLYLNYCIITSIMYPVSLFSSHHFFPTFLLFTSNINKGKTSFCATGVVIRDKLMRYQFDRRSEFVEGVTYAADDGCTFLAVIANFSKTQF